MKKTFYLAIFSLIVTANIQAILVTGDPLAATGESFSFDLGFASFDAGSDYSPARLWIANNDASMSTYDDTVKPYGMCFATQYASYVAPGTEIKATPMTNEEAATVFTFDGTNANAIGVNPNPLWGAQFHLFTVPAQQPLFVLTDSKNKIYLTEDIKRYETPTETERNVTALIQHDFGVGEETHALIGYGKDIIFAAHATGAFGSTTSKITNLVRTTQTNSYGTFPYLKTIADNTISTSTNALKGGASGANLAALGSTVNLTLILNNLFIGLDTTANAAVGSCATALTFATLIETAGVYNFQFNEVAPAALLTTGSDTIISAAASNQARITNVAYISTSTGLSYVIVARDNGTGPQTVYALPIITAGSDLGKIADFRSIANSFGVQPPLFLSRQFDTIVSNFADIDPAGAYATQLTVGGQTPPLASGTSLHQMYTVGDSVYVVVDNGCSTGQTPGTFYSQPIYAQDGHIVSWTPWQRVLGTDHELLYSFVDRKTLSGYYIANITTNYRALFQTTFTTDSDLSPILLNVGNGGIQGLFNFPRSTTGFNNEISLMISTSYGQTVIAQTGYMNSNSLFAIAVPINTLTFAGAHMNNQEAMIAGEIAHNGANHWIFVGGVKGLSVLTGNEDGVSWTGTLASIADLNAGQTFKTVGNFSYIKKLVWDASNTYLYVMTSTELYRIALNPNKFTATPTADLNAELILSSSELSNNAGYFLDMIIDSGFCVIGSTNGLFTVDFSNNKNVQKVPVSNGLPAISQLKVVSASDDPQRNFKTLSNLIVLNNSFGTQQARINRFVITDGTVAPFDDFLLTNKTDNSQGIPTSFVKFDNYVTNYFTDGSWNIASCYYLGVNQPSTVASTPSALQLFTGIRSGFSSSQMILPYFSGYAPLSFINSVNLAGFIRESTSGSVIAYGSFQSHAND